MAADNKVSSKLKRVLSSPRRRELATDIWLFENGHAPNATQNLNGFLRSLARRERRAGGARGPRVAFSITSEDFIDNLPHNIDPLDLLVGLENAIEADDYWGK